MAYLPEYTPIPMFRQHGISTSGDIKNLSTGESVKTYLGRRSEVFATLSNDFDRAVKVSVAELVLLVYAPLAHDADYDQASIIYIDDNPQNVKLTNLVWTLVGYVPRIIPGVTAPPNAFVRIPEYPNYEIDLKGCVRHIRSLHVLNTEINVNGYLEACLTDIGGVSRTIHVHRLLALAFLPHPLNVDRLMVNHIDGRKLNNSLWNLEWCTASENGYHAIYTGLRGDDMCDAVLAMDVKTREIQEFPSLATTAQRFGTSSQGIRDLLINPRGIQIYRGHFLKYADDSTPWPEGESIAPPPMTVGLAVVVKKLATGEITHYRSIIETAEALGCSPSSIHAQIQYDFPIPFRGYLIREDTPHVSWKFETKRERHARKYSCAVQTTDVATGEVKVWPSLGLLCVELGVPYSTFYAAIRTGRECHGKLVEYVTDGKMATTAVK